MPRELTDEQMRKLEASGVVKTLSLNQKKPKEFSDEQMKQFEKEGIAKDFSLNGRDGHSSAQTLLEHYGNAATLGYLPELQAATGRLLPNPNAAIDAKLKSEGFNIIEPTGYIAERDQNVRRLKEQERENPKAALVGSLAGAGASALLTAGLMPPLGAGVSTGAKAIQAAKAGAIQSALQNPGSNKGDVSPLQLEERVKNAALGGVLGGGLSLGVSGLTKGASALSEALKGKAEEKAAKSAGMMLKDFRALYGKDKVNEVGRELLDSEVVTPLATPTKIAERVSPSIEAKNKQVADLVARYSEKLKDPKFIENLTPESKEKLASVLYNPEKESVQLFKQFVDKYGEENIDRLSPALNEFRSLGSQGSQSLSLADTQAQKQRLNNLVKDTVYNKLPKDRSISDSALLARQGSLRQGVENVSDFVASQLGENPGQVKEINRRMGNLIQMKDIAQDRIARDAANRAFGLTDTISGGIGATIGGIIGGPPGAVIGTGTGMLTNKLSREYANPLMATGFDAAAKRLAQVPAYARLAQENPARFGFLVSKMIQEQAPQVRDSSPSSDEIEIFRQNPSLLKLIKDEKTRSAIDRRISGGK